MVNIFLLYMLGSGWVEQMENWCICVRGGQLLWVEVVGTRVEGFFSALSCPLL